VAPSAVGALVACSEAFSRSAAVIPQTLTKIPRFGEVRGCDLDDDLSVNFHLMPEYRFCFSAFKSDDATQIASLFINGCSERKAEFKYVHEFLDAMSSEGFVLIQHTASTLSSRMFHYFTFKRG
jgi:hypothetical protein